jgi:hypothetical protein
MAENCDFPIPSALKFCMQSRTNSFLLGRFLLVALVALSMSRARISAQAPNAPVPQTKESQQDANRDEQANQQSNRPEQTKRILGIIPNFRAVSNTTVLPAQSVGEKFMTATQDSFDYSAIFVPAALAGYNLGTNANPEFGHGAEGYGRYFWRAGVDQTSENYFVEFVYPVTFRQDNRYYTLGHGGFFKRTGYSLSRVLITRSDDAREVFNVSEVLGAGSSAALSTTYYPASQQNFASVGKQWGLGIGIDALSFTVKEFWPDINYRLFHGSRPDGSAPAQPEK